jgi:predicted small lipoprotein YifL
MSTFKKATIVILACSFLACCGIKGKLELEHDIDEQVDATI